MINTLFKPAALQVYEILAHNPSSLYPAAMQLLPLLGNSNRRQVQVQDGDAGKEGFFLKHLTRPLVKHAPLYMERTGTTFSVRFVSQGPK